MTTAPRAPADSPAEPQAAPSEGLRVLARIIARAYLRDLQPPSAPSAPDPGRGAP